MRLIEMIRKARENGHRWIAVDNGDIAFSYHNKPAKFINIWADSSRTDIHLGEYSLTCNWRDSLIDVTKLKGIK